MRCVALILLVALSARAATYYVRTDGDDLNSGTSNTAEGAWLTVQKAASTMVAGDTAIVADGQYPENVSSGAHGTAENPIIFLAQSTNAVLRGFSATHQYQVVDGFTLTGDSINLDASFYAAAGAHNCTVQHCTFASSLPSVFQVATALGVTDVVTNLHVLNNRFINPWYHGIELRTGHSHLIESNLFTTMTGNDAIQVFADGVVIRGNVFTNWDNGPTVSAPVKTGVRYYFDTVGAGADFSNIGAGAPPYSAGEDGSPFTATGTTPTAWGDGTVLYPGNHPDIIQSHNMGGDNHSAHDLVFERNLVIDCDGQVQIGNVSDDLNSGNISNWTFRNNIYVRVDRTFNLYAPNFKFYNNTFYQCFSGSGFAVIAGESTAGSGTNTTIMNNIFMGCGYAANNGWYDVQTTGRTNDYNLVCGLDGSAKVGFSEVHGINGNNPLFVNAAANDFRLSTNSPAIGAGYARNDLFTTDIRGLTRGAAWDIGAYEFQEGEAVEPEPEEPPAAVSGSATAARANVETLILR